MAPCMVGLPFATFAALIAFSLMHMDDAWALVRVVIDPVYVMQSVRMAQAGGGGGVFYSCLGHCEGAYNPCPKWARIYRLMAESGSKAFLASRAPKV